MVIAITGSNGFFGSHFLDLVKKKHISFKQFNRKKEDLESVPSLRNFVAGSDVIVHFAGVSKNHSEDEIRRVNIEGTQNLVKAIIKYNPQARLIFISSFQVYSPDDTFGKSKKAGEKIIDDFKKTHNLNASILRFSNLYGPNCPTFQHSVISTFIELIKRNEPITLIGGGVQKRDFLYITDACDAILKLIKRSDIDNPLDICTGKMVRLSEVVEMLRGFAKREVTVYNKPLVETNNYIVKKNYKKAYEELGWKPKVSLEKGLKQILKYEKVI